MPSARAAAMTGPSAVAIESDGPALARRDAIGQGQRAVRAVVVARSKPGGIPGCLTRGVEHDESRSDEAIDRLPDDRLLDTAPA
jgi:hypothetical protein